MPTDGNEIRPDLENLKSYKDEKLFIASQLHIIREAFSALGLKEAEKECGELTVKFAEDRFTLAVIGQFKRGKSSLMNAIIGKELLPTGVLPLTSAITILKYGPAERLQVNYEHLQFPQDQPLSALPEFVTESGNPDNHKRVKSVNIEMPVPFLRYGIEFVDTPGVGSAFRANTATTYNFLPECDAVVFVTAVDTPMTSLELELLEAVSQYASKLFFVINKIDLITEKERSEVSSFVLKTITSVAGPATKRIYEVSSRKALEGRTTANPSLYAQSGLQQLEDDLGDFLSKQKAAAFLTAITQKLLKLVSDEANEGAFGEASLAARLNELEQQTVKTVYQQPYEALSSLLKAQKKLLAAYPNNKVEAISMPEIAVAKTDTQITEASALIKEAEPVQLAADLHTRSCPVCRPVAEQLSDFYAHWQYLLSSQETAQEEFAAETGFCPLHTWQLLSMTSPYGASLGFPKLAETIAGRLNKLNEKDKTVWKLVEDSRDCRVCNLVKSWEQQMIRSLAEHVSTGEGRDAYRHSEGACLRHLSMLLEIISEKETEWLIAFAAERFGQDAEDMRTYAVKQEALRRGLQNKDEDDAYRRMMIRLVGDRSVCIPWKTN